MTKSNPRNKNERKSIKKRRNEKYNFIHLEDFENCCLDTDGCGLQVASKQQYLRCKKKKFIQKYWGKKETNKIRSVVPKEVTLPCLIIKDNNNNSPKSKGALSNESNEISESPTAFTFHIQQDWSDFEDMDHLNFVSENDFDLNNVLHILNGNQTFDFETFPELSLAYDLSGSHLSNQETEPFNERFDQTIILINNLEEYIRNNSQSVFEIDSDQGLWMAFLQEINHLSIVCESNKCILHDTLMKDYSISLEEKYFKWNELASKCLAMKSCVEIIKDFESIKEHFQISIEILYDQCLSLLEHGGACSYPLFSGIIGGIKKISKVLKTHYSRSTTSLKELFHDYKEHKMIILDQLDEEINSVEKLSFSNENISINLESVLNVLGKYLGREKKWISVKEPVSHSCHYGMEPPKSFIGALKQSYNFDEFFAKIPLKIVIVVLMSLMCLFGNLEVEQLNSTTNVLNQKMFNESMHSFHLIQRNNESGNF